MIGQIVAEKGSQLDIRLPIIITSLCNPASAGSQDRSDSPVSSRGGFRERDRMPPPMMAFKGSRSKSLQTNSLGLAVSSSPRVTTRAAALKLSPIRDNNDLNHITEEVNSDVTNIDITPFHGVKYKVYK